MFFFNFLFYFKFSIVYTKKKDFEQFKYETFRNNKDIKI